MHPVNPVRRTSSGVAHDGPGRLQAAVLVGGSAAATATFYDGTDNTGRVLLILKGPAAETRLGPDVCIPFYTGLYVELAGTGAEAISYV